MSSSETQQTPPPADDPGAGHSGARVEGASQLKDLGLALKELQLEMASWAKHRKGKADGNDDPRDLWHAAGELLALAPDCRDDRRSRDCWSCYALVAGLQNIILSKKRKDALRPCLARVWEGLSSLRPEDAADPARVPDQAAELRGRVDDLCHEAESMADEPAVIPFAVVNLFKEIERARSGAPIDSNPPIDIETAAMVVSALYFLLADRDSGLLSQWVALHGPISAMRRGGGAHPFAESARSRSSASVGTDVQPKLVPLRFSDPVTITEESWENSSPIESSRLSCKVLRSLPWISLGLNVALMAALCYLTLNRGWAPTAGNEVHVKLAEPASATAKALEPPQPRELAERFLNAKSLATRLRLVRDPRYASLMRRHYETVGPEESEVLSLRPLGRQQIQELVFFPFHVKFASGRNRYLCVVDEPHGRSVDWEAYARFGTASWDEILGGNAKSAEVRVFIQPDRYFNHTFSDTSKYRCYRLASPDCERDLYGYLELGTNTARILRQVILSNLKDEHNRQTSAGRLPKNIVLPSQHRMTVLIESVDDSHTNGQFLISQITASGWVKLDGDAFEDQWIDVELEPTEEEKFEALVRGAEAQNAKDTRPSEGQFVPTTR